MARARASFYWQRPPEAIAQDLNAWIEVNIHSRALRRAEDLAKDIVSWMQDNAPWEDRTGEARASLAVDVERQGNNIVMVIRHGVEYGVWLELMNAGEFAILSKAVAFWAPQITDRMK